VNRLERVLDRSPAAINARLRLIKKMIKRDVMLHVMKHLVRPGDVAADVGANRGVYTLYLARRVGSEGRVHSIDPFPTNAAALSAGNARRPQVVVHHAAVSDRSGTARLHVPVLSGEPIHALASLHAPRNPQGLSYLVTDVKVLRLHEVLADDSARLSFMKCDVEGHELAVLGGAASLLQERKPHVVVEIEQRHQEQDIHLVFEQMYAWGYQGFAFFPEGLRPLQDFDVGRDQLAHVSGDFVPYGMPRGYVSDFLFARPGTDLTPLLA
jgi:FkbM family methyltransferase